MKNKLLLTAMTVALMWCFVGNLRASFSPLHTSTSLDEKPLELPILMYHSFLKEPAYQSRYVIHPDLFEDDLRYMREHGYTPIVVQDLIDYVENGAPLPEKPIMLTFDDGYYNNYVYAFPLLEKYGMLAVISVVGRYADDFTESGDLSPYYAYLTWDNIEEMHASGLIEFQNHTYDLHTGDKGRIGVAQANGEPYDEYLEFLKDDITLLQQHFIDRLGFEPRCFTYPFGSYSDLTDDALRELGFKATLSCYEGVNYVTQDPECLFRLKRFLRLPDMSSEETFARFEKD